LIVANARDTKLDRAATHVLRYTYAAETSLILAMLSTLSAKRPDLPPVAQELMRDPAVQEAAKVFAGAENAVILFGSDGASLDSSRALAQACAHLLMATHHVGRPNNGLVGVWQRVNDQAPGIWASSIRNLKEAMKAAKTLYVVGVDPAGDDLELAEAASFLVVQDLFLTSTAKLADVFFTGAGFYRTGGTYTSVSGGAAFLPAVPARQGVLRIFDYSKDCRTAGCEAGNLCRCTRDGSDCDQPAGLPGCVLFQAGGGC
jgi:NADH-quinone oxidoreductase subunit G